MHPIYCIWPIFVNCLRRVGGDSRLLFLVICLSLPNSLARKKLLGCFCIREWWFLQPTMTGTGLWNPGPLPQSGRRKAAGTCHT